MIRIFAALLCAVSLGGCFFAGNGGELYRSYGTSWGYYVASASVNTFCLSPRLRSALGDFERRFGRKVVISSGFRDPFHNARVGGADGSYHMKCMAADFFIPGISKRDLIAHARSSGHVGGLGCYPGKSFIHIDVRDRPKGWRGPVEFSGC